jgi:hypothetical protein
MRLTVKKDFLAQAGLHQEAFLKGSCKIFLGTNVEFGLGPTRPIFMALRMFGMADIPCSTLLKTSPCARHW